MKKYPKCPYRYRYQYRYFQDSPYRYQYRYRYFQDCPYRINIDINISKIVLIDINSDIDIFQNGLIDIDIDIFNIVLINIDIFQKCRYINNLYFISIYRTGLPFIVITMKCIESFLDTNQMSLTAEICQCKIMLIQK